MTSMRRSSWLWTTRFKSRRRTLVLTVAPASRHMRAAALSNGMALGRSKPERGHDARWSPRASRRRLQGQVAGTKGNCKRKRRRSSTRKEAGSSRSSGEVGSAVKTLAATGQTGTRTMPATSRQVAVQFTLPNCKVSLQCSTTKSP